MPSILSIRFRRARRFRNRQGRAPGAIESLERRLLMTMQGAPELDVVGRASDGNWVDASFDWDSGTVQHHELIFAKWSPAANWTDVLHGDFDGDGVDDVIGRDPASGYWWASLADGVGSTTLLAGAWSNATSWSDVAIAHLPNPKVIAAEPPLGPGPVTDPYDDLIGRASDGTWWAALSNGDGTFTNSDLTSWNPAAGWKDVLYAGGDSGIVMYGRASDGNWWQTTGLFATDGSIHFTSRNIAMWNEAAGWRDVMYVPQFLSTVGSQSNPADFPAIVGRTSTGAWWAMRGDNGFIPTYVGSWNEAAGWRDVGVLQGSYFQGDAIVGRTSTGEWFRSKFNGSVLVSDLIGQWDESAGWRNVQTVTFEPENGPRAISNGILGVNSAGAWQMLTQRFSGTTDFATAPMGLISGSAAWQDVQVGRFSRDPVAFGYVTTVGAGPFFLESRVFKVSILARRTGVSVDVADSATFPDRLVITYFVPTTNFTRVVAISVPMTLASMTFSGHIGGDRFENRSTKASVRAIGRAGDDLLDSTNGIDHDFLFGGPGLDVLLGDPGDDLVQ